MLAVVTREGDGYAARFERRLNHRVEKVWAMLTENEKLAQWFPELRTDELREGGRFKFDMEDGSFEEMAILELKPLSVLAYTWGKDRVRFELHPEDGGCRLELIEFIQAVTDHTPKDLAGWHVCLDVIAALLDGTTVENRKGEWEKVFPEYKRLVEEAK